MSNSAMLHTNSTERRDAKRGLWLLVGVTAVIMIGVASCNGIGDSAANSA